MEGLSLQPRGQFRPVTLAADLVAELIERKLTIAVAESLTGGLLVAELVSVPGASAVVNGGVVAYSTELKRTLLKVPAHILALNGPVHPDVAVRMAASVRELLAVGGVAADIGIATTGVAGPGPHGGQKAGTAFVAVAVGSDVRVRPLDLDGTREEIRNGVVYESLMELKKRLGSG